MNLRFLPPMVLLLLVPTPAAAEIIDKMPSIGQLWIFNGIIVALVLLAWLWKKWLGVLLWVFAAFFVGLGIEDAYSPGMEEAILNELGQRWFDHLWGSTLAVWSLPIFWLIYNARGMASAEVGKD